MNLLTDQFLPNGPSILDALNGAGLLPDGVSLADPLLDEVVVEFLACFLWLLGRPENERAWRDTWQAGRLHVDQPMVDTLAPCFELFEGSRAFQDNTVSNLPEQPIAGLFHAAPGDQTTKHNKDIGTPIVRGMLPGVAAVALYAMQAFAHAGGPGFRTSVAGGGPLRTVPRIGDTPFRRAWALVLSRDEHEAGMDRQQREMADQAALPWVVPPGATPVAGMAHPLLALFATPRRILLSPPTTQGRCSLTGIEGDLVTHFREGQNGPEYSAAGFRHPWTPYRTESGKPALPTLANSRPAAFGWRDWSGLVAERPLDKGVTQRPAAVTEVWRRKRLRAVPGTTATLHLAAYGVRCDKAKVLGFVRGTHAFDVVPEDAAPLYQAGMHAAIAAVEQAARWLAVAVREVVNDGSKDRKDPVERQVRGRSDALWAALEAAGAQFSHALAQAVQQDWAGSAAASLQARTRLHQAVCRAAETIFDDATGDAILQPDTAQRAGRARNRLMGSLRGAEGRAKFSLAEPAGKDAGQ